MKGLIPKILIVTLMLWVSTCVNAGSWPRPSNIRLFVPFDSESKMDDVANNAKPDRALWPKLRTDIPGPFGKTGTSYGIETSPSYICGFENEVAKSQTFTYAFYYYYTESELNPKFNAILLNDGPPVFGVGYGGNNGLEITSYGSIVATVPNILTPSKWNFVAITYDDDAKELKLYDAYGSVTYQAAITIKPPPYTFALHFFVGLHYRPDGVRSNIRPTDAVACLFVYNSTLDSGEISQLPGVCQTKGQGPPPPTQAPPTTKQTVPITTQPPVTTKTTQDVPETTPRSTSTTSRPLPASSPWPQPNALLAFYPLSASHERNDVSPNNFSPDKPNPNVMHVTGPFGDEVTAAKTFGPEPMLQIQNSKLAVTNAFTVSMFLNIGGETGGLFEFIDQYHSSKAFQIRYENATTLEVSANGVSIGHYTMIQQNGAWTFVAFTFKEGNLVVYSRNGVFATATAKPEITSSMASNNNGIRLGYASRWAQLLPTTDVVACLMVYSTALTAPEIRQAYDSCRVLHDAAPCGAPRLPLSPIPSSSSGTTIPKDGQFPWVASLRLGKTHICSASIIDAYWLISAASCFPASPVASSYKVYVGERDLNVNELHTEQFGVSKIMVFKDVALIQVSDPIDFRNQYVNDACLLMPGDDKSDLDMNSPKFVFGWGKNGRPAIVSQGLPRYAYGSVLGDSVCSAAWGSTYKQGTDMCFMSSTGDKNVPCGGDEGSPLFLPALANPASGKGDRVVQVGIYYKRDADCTPEMPGLFVNLEVYGTWIAQQIACAVPGVTYPTWCPQF